MYVNLWLWNSALYIDFDQAVKENDAVLACRYIEQDSEAYHRVKKALEGAKEVLDDDYLTIEEVPYATDVNG